MLEEIRIAGGTIEYKYELSGSVSKYFRLDSPLYIEYSENMEGVPEGIAVIPFLTNILPIAWLCNTQIHVKEIDRNFFDSVREFKKGYEKMQPNIAFRGELIADKIVDYQCHSSERTATFFSGGIDSHATLINRLDKKPDLITIWGADLSHDDVQGWQKVKAEVQAKADKFDLKTVFIKSGFRVFIKEGTLDRDFFGMLGEYWWYGIQHGIGIIGHAAPYAYVQRIKTVYIPATYISNDYNHIKCASRLDIDNKVRFGCSNVLHEGSENNRQNKIKMICQYCQRNNEQLFLRVCWESSGGGNCSHCEKCARSIMGIIAEHSDPRQFGFEINDQTMRYIRQQVKHKWEIKPITNWLIIQARFIADREQWIDDDNINWILTHDFEKNNRSVRRRLRRITSRVSSKIPTSLKKVITYYTKRSGIVKK